MYHSLLLSYITSHLSYLLVYIITGMSLSLMNLYLLLPFSLVDLYHLIGRLFSYIILDRSYTIKSVGCISDDRYRHSCCDSCDTDCNCSLSVLYVYIRNADFSFAASFYDRHNRRALHLGPLRSCHSETQPDGCTNNSSG